MENKNPRGFTTPQIIIFVLALAVVVGGYFAFGAKTSAPITQTQNSIPTSTFAQVNAEISDWLSYNWNGSDNISTGLTAFTFRYPPTWSITKTNYTTAAGISGIVGLSLVPPNGSDYYSNNASNPEIWFGGRQFDCKNDSSKTTRCFTTATSYPIYTYSNDSRVLKIFDLLVFSIIYSNNASSVSGVDTTGWQTYEHSQREYSLKYPYGTKIIDPFSWRETSYGVSFSLPQEYLQGTNLANDSYISVEFTQTCSASSFVNFGGPNDSVTTEIVNGINYSVATHSEAGAGNFYTEVVYFTPQNSAHIPCSGIRLFLHSNNLTVLQENNPNIKVFDKNKIMDFFRKVVQGVNFTVSD